MVRSGKCGFGRRVFLAPQPGFNYGPSGAGKDTTPAAFLLACASGAAERLMENRWPRKHPTSEDPVSPSLAALGSTLGSDSEDGTHYEIRAKCPRRFAEPLRPIPRAPASLPDSAGWCSGGLVAGCGCR